MRIKKKYQVGDFLVDPISNSPKKHYRWTVRRITNEISEGERVYRKRNQAQ